MNRRRTMMLGGGLIALIAALWLGQRALGSAGAGQASGEAPIFAVDPLWPKPLPNHWLVGTSIGLWVDDQDNVWMVHRGAPDLDPNERGLELGTAECCATAPHVLAFDPEGNLIQAWGGPGQGYDWPESLHGIFVDDMGYVWLGASGPGDSHFLKFTQDGTFVQQYGRPNARLGQPDSEGQPTFTPDSNDPENFGRVAELAVDPAANEVYVADGYFNKRVAVVDATTGAIKRYWGAYGNRPDDAYVFSAPGSGDPQNPPQQFRGSVHCIGLSNEGLLDANDKTGRTFNHWFNSIPSP